MRNCDLVGDFDQAVELYRKETNKYLCNCIPGLNSSGDFVEWLLSERPKKSQKQIDVQLLKDIKNYLEFQAGIGEVYGTLGHLIGGVLSHSVLYNDPHDHALDENGKEKKCTLSDENYRQIMEVYRELKEMVKRGKDAKLVEKLSDLIT